MKFIQNRIQNKKYAGKKLVWSLINVTIYKENVTIKDSESS
jgi:hypothetical protein